MKSAGRESAKRLLPGELKKSEIKNINKNLEEARIFVPLQMDRVRGLQKFLTCF